MAELYTRKGDVILVDDADVLMLSAFTWRLDKDGYACTNPPRSATKPRSILRMHRVILGCSKGEIVDHINGNRLDNRRENLRLVTKEQNQQNRGPNKGRRFKGVFKITRPCIKPWWATIGVNKKNTYLGTFATEEEAARAYDKAAKVLFGAYAKLNFPET